MKIGSCTPLWNQELFLKPHFEMLSKGVDRSIVLMQKGPLPSYKREHGYSSTPDLSKIIIEDYFPEVEVYDSTYNNLLDFGSELYNEGLALMDDCDIVLRLDPDMFFTDDDFQKFIEFIHKKKADCFQMDFRRDSINYYMTGDFDHGLKDAQEDDALAINPKIFFKGILDYPSENKKVIDIPNWTCHHFRGWNKPKSFYPNWASSVVSNEYKNQFWDKKNRDWYHCPKEIRVKLEVWLKELEQIKEEMNI